MHIRKLAFTGDNNNANVVDGKNPYDIYMAGYTNDLYAAISYSEIEMNGDRWNDVRLFGSDNELDLSGKTNWAFVEGGDNYVSASGQFTFADFFGDWNSYSAGAGNSSVYSSGDGFFARLADGDNDILADGDDTYIRGGDEGTDEVEVNGDFASLFLKGGANIAHTFGNGLYYSGGDDEDHVTHKGDNSLINALGGDNTVELTGNNNVVEAGAVDDRGTFILGRSMLMIGGSNNELRVAGDTRVFLMPRSDGTQITAMGGGDTTVFLMPKAGAFSLSNQGDGRTTIINLADDFDPYRLAQAFAAGQNNWASGGGGEKGRISYSGDPDAQLAFASDELQVWDGGGPETDVNNHFGL